MLNRICLQEKLKPSCLRGGVVVKTSEIFISKIDISVLNRMVQPDRIDCVLLYYLQGVRWEPALGGMMLNAWPTVRNSHKWLRVVASQRTLCKGGKITRNQDMYVLRVVWWSICYSTLHKSWKSLRSVSRAMFSKLQNIAHLLQKIGTAYKYNGL